MGRDRRYEIEDTGMRDAKHSSGGRQTISVPQGLQFWKPKKSGSHNIDIVPYVVTDAIKRYPDNLVFARLGKLWYERTFFTHSKIGVNEDSFTCPAKTFGQRCPMCEVKARLRQSPRKEDEEAAKVLQWSERQLFLVLDLDEYDKGLQLWEVANWNFGKQLDEFIKGARPVNRDAYRRFFAPDGGFSMRITGTEKGMGGGRSNTTYSINEFFPREREWSDKLLDHGFDLDAMVRQMEYDALNQIFRGTADPDEVDGDEGGGDDGGIEYHRPPARNGESASYRSSAENPPSSPTRRDREEPRQEAREERRPAPRREPDPEPPPPPPPAPAARRNPPPPPKFASRDVVRFKYKGEDVEGTIEKVNYDKNVAHVRVEGWDRPSIQDFEDLELVSSDDTFDLKEAQEEAPPPPPPPPARPRNAVPAAKAEAPQRAAPGKWDDDEDDGRSFQRKAPPPQDEDPPPPPKKKR